MKRGLLIAFVLALSLYGHNARAQAVTTSADAYKAIVKIKTLSVNVDGFLTTVGTGSGVIISSDGLVVTNNHVVSATYEGAALETTFQVCLNSAINLPPDCSYVADLVARDSALDLALLRIKPIAGLATITTFPFLTMATVDTAEVGDTVQAIGFPSIGDETVSVTNGIVSGKLSQYGNEWIKNDAIISFGSSGGGLIDSSGTLIGISTQGYADLLASLGYAINIASVQDWINVYTTLPGVASSLQNRTIAFTKLQRDLNASNTFVKSHPYLTVTKPNGWTFMLNREDLLTIAGPSGLGAGGVVVAIEKAPFEFSVDAMITEIKSDLLEDFELGVTTVRDLGNRTFGAYVGKHLRTSQLDDSISIYYIPYKDTIVFIAYDYGANDALRGEVDSILASLSLQDNGVPVTQLTEYSQTHPNFSVSTNNDWGIEVKAIPGQAVNINNKNLPNTSFDIETIPIDSLTETYTTETIVNFLRDSFEEINLIADQINLRFDFVSTDSNYYVNDEITQALRTDMVLVNPNSNVVLARSLGIVVVHEGYIKSVSATTYGDNSEEYARAVEALNQLLVNFSLTPNIRRNSTTSTAPANNTSQPTTHTAPSDGSLADRLRGRILLQVESNGEAWYVHPDSARRFYMRDGGQAYTMMRSFGLGITNADLEKIPVGVEDRFNDLDTDGDGLPDKMEEGIGTDPENPDTDGDGFNDGTEVRSGYNPTGQGAMPHDSALVNRLKGYIVLQVESKGEAWYINPDDGKRYYLKDGEAAYQIMRFLSLGITNADLNQIQSDTL